MKTIKIDVIDTHKVAIYRHGKLVYEDDAIGLPIGFEFPFSKRDEWTDCCNELYEQGFEIVKK